MLLAPKVKTALRHRADRHCYKRSMMITQSRRQRLLGLSGLGRTCPAAKPQPRQQVTFSAPAKPPADFAAAQFSQIEDACFRIVGAAIAELLPATFSNQPDRLYASLVEDGVDPRMALHVAFSSPDNAALFYGTPEGRRKQMETLGQKHRGDRGGTTKLSGPNADKLNKAVQRGVISESEAKAKDQADRAARKPAVDHIAKQAVVSVPGAKEAVSKNPGLWERIKGAAASAVHAGVKAVKAVAGRMAGAWEGAKLGALHGAAIGGAGGLMAGAIFPGIITGGLAGATVGAGLGVAGAFDKSVKAKEASARAQAATSDASRLDGTGDRAALELEHKAKIANKMAAKVAVAANDTASASRHREKQKMHARNEKRLLSN